MINEAVLIRPVNKRNGITLTVFGLLGIVAGLSLFLSGSHLFAPGIVCFAFGAITAVLGCSHPRSQYYTCLPAGLLGLLLLAGLTHHPCAASTAS